MAIGQAILQGDGSDSQRKAATPPQKKLKKEDN